LALALNQTQDQDIITIAARGAFQMTNYSSAPFLLGTTTRQLFFRKQSTDESVIKQVLIDQQYNLARIGRSGELLAFAKQQEANGRRPLIVDAGANMGAASIYFIANMPNALVVAIEPDLENFKLLSKNVEGLNVEAIRSAISFATGRVRVVDPGRGHWAYRTQPISEGADVGDAVPSITINDIYDSHRSAFFPFIVKIDVEGAEADLFSGNTEWVARTPIIIIELHDWLLPKGGTSRPFLECISKMNRDFVYLGEDVYSIANDLSGLADARP
jgi:FkbM family methyltransferase